MITLRSFTGAYPVVPAQLLPDNAAQYAKDVDLRNNEINGLHGARTPSAINLPSGTLGAWTPDGFRFLTSKSPIRAALSPVIDDRWGRLYFTDDNGLRVCNQADLTPTGSAVTSYFVGVPPPTAAVTLKKVRKARWPSYPNTALKLKFFLSANGQRYNETATITPTVKSGAEPFSSYTFNSGVNAATIVADATYVSVGGSIQASSIYNESTAQWLTVKSGTSVFIASDGISYTSVNGTNQTLGAESASKVTLTSGKIAKIDWDGSLAAAASDPTNTPSAASPSIEIWLENLDNSGERIWTAYAGTTASGALDSFPGGASVALTPTGDTTYQIDFNFGVTESRSYLYTFFNEWQEESQPSMPASVDVTYLDDVELSVNLTDSSLTSLFSGHVKFDRIQFYCAGASGSYLGINTSPVNSVESAMSVVDLYRMILWREPDPVGLAYWNSQHQTGMSLADIAAAMYASREYQDQETFVAIEDLYVKLLNRLPDDAGFSFWRGAFENGATLQNIIWSVLNSPEYRTLHPTDNNASTSVTWWYQTFLGRDPDASGAAYWPAKISSNRMALANMLTIMLGSQEYRTREATTRVTELLTVVLGRAPTSAETAEALEKYSSHQTFNALAYTYSVQHNTSYYKDEGTRTGTALASLEWMKPSPDLRMLTQLPNGVFAAVKGREIHFSEPYMPYAWPTAYIQTSQFSPVGMMAANGQLLITTEGSPIAISGAHPGGMTQQKIGAVEAGVAEYGMTVVSGLPVYASRDGIVSISGLSGSLDLSHRFWTSDKWREKYGARLTGIKLIAHDGKLVGLFDQGDGFIIYYGAAAPYVVEFSQKGGYPFTIPSQEMIYLATETGIKELFYQDESVALLPYTWWSKEFELPRYDSFSAAKIVSSGDVTLTFFGDGQPFYSYTVSTPSLKNTTIRLPATAKYFRFSVKAEGTAKIQELRAGNSMREMTLG